MEENEHRKKLFMRNFWSSWSCFDLIHPDHDFLNSSLLHLLHNIIFSAFDAAMNMFNGASTPDRTYTRQVIFYITDSNPYALILWKYSTVCFRTQDLASLNKFKQKGIIIVNSAVHRTGLWNLASEGYFFIESSTKHVLRAFCKGLSLNINGF